MPDAAEYGDEGADTLGHTIEAMGPGFSLPNMASLGLSLLLAGKISPASGRVAGGYGKMASASPAKDTTAGHWELAGLVLDKPFPVYPRGFPEGVIREFEKRIGTKTIGNCPASGTEIIRILGDEHCRTGYPIVYTSADSVFQVAAHENAFGLDRLYDACRAARELLSGEHAVGRVIARPFLGDSGQYYRTANRRDFSLDPFSDTILDRIRSAGGDVTAIGKIGDIFNGRGITRALHTSSNREGILKTIDAISSTRSNRRELIFANLVDFDMLWGHRRDVKSYATGLQEFDSYLPSILDVLKEDDLLMITADHGCDPTFSGHTDHTREYVPLLVCGKKLMGRADLGVRSTLSDVAQTIADLFGIEPVKHGKSFRKELGL